MRRPKAQWRGGIGSVREFAFLSDGAFSVEGEGHKYRPWGFAGGEDGSTASLSLRRGAGDETAPPVESSLSRERRRGDRLVATGPNGGGYGNPFERDPEAVLSDMLDGYISAEQAETDYGVVIRGKALGRGGDRRASGERGRDEIATDGFRCARSSSTLRA